jgi:hypothetical protein
MVENVRWPWWRVAGWKTAFAFRHGSTPAARQTPYGTRGKWWRPEAGRKKKEKEERERFVGDRLKKIAEGGCGGGVCGAFSLGERDFARSAKRGLTELNLTLALGLFSA